MRNPSQSLREREKSFVGYFGAMGGISSNGASGGTVNRPGRAAHDSQVQVRSYHHLFTEMNDFFEISATMD